MGIYGVWTLALLVLQVLGEEQLTSWQAVGTFGLTVTGTVMGFMVGQDKDSP